MKKALLIALTVLLIAVPVFAASNSGVTKNGSVGVGINLGTNTGVGLRFGMGDFDLIANVGLDTLHIGKGGFSMAADAAASYKVYTLEAGKADFPITLGLGANVGILFSDAKTGVSVAAVVPVGIEYTFDEVPVTVYLRLAPGVQILTPEGVKIGFGFSGYLGALWNF